MPTAAAERRCYTPLGRPLNGVSINQQDDEAWAASPHNPKEPTTNLNGSVIAGSAG